jgi:4-hydroxy-tetrahydrodipicolinate reductase
VRGGTIVGDHEVIFAGRDEVIELHHHAHSREIFASGAVKAAKFLNGKANGLYSMADLVSASLA